jgi:TPR repeat protein
MNGDGVEKNVRLAVNWLATAAKKQHAAAQATLGEILWRGQAVRPRQARGLALIILAHQNAVAGGKEPQWIGDLYREALDKSDAATRKDADAMLPELGNAQTANLMPTAKAKPTEVMVVPAGGATVKAAPPTTSAAADTVPSSSPGAPPPAPIGMSVGYGTTSPKP